MTYFINADDLKSTAAKISILQSLVKRRDSLLKLKNSMEKHMEGSNVGISPFIKYHEVSINNYDTLDFNPEAILVAVEFELNIVQKEFKKLQPVINAVQQLSTPL